MLGQEHFTGAGHWAEIWIVTRNHAMNKLASA